MGGNAACLNAALLAIHPHLAVACVLSQFVAKKSAEVAMVRLGAHAQLPAALDGFKTRALREQQGVSLPSTSREAPRRRATVVSVPCGNRRISLPAVLEIARRTVGSAIDADAPLMEAGVDSLGAVELRNQLQRTVGDDTPLSTTLMFDHPTARQVAIHLQGNAPVLASARRGDAPSVANHAPVEIAGLGMVLPVGVSHLATLRKSSHCGRDLLRVIPASRWDVEEAALDLVASPPEVLSRVRHGAFLVDAELFENGFFGVSPAEASAMDPQQRQLLERGYVALHSAGERKSTLQGGVVAVNVGQWASEFGSVLVRTPAGRSVYAGTAFACSVTCGRVSFVLGLQGPCSSYDTACSASLVANHGSMRAIQRIECDAALSTGVNIILDPSLMRNNAVGGFTSIRGRSHTFDTRADGYARGESTNAFACRVGDRSAALWMRGSAVRQDGRSASLTAPNGQAQQGVLAAALDDAQQTVEQARLHEAHGTGTSLGDPIEASAVAAVFLRERMPISFAVGSLKANAGHTETAAGTSGALKLLMQLQDLMSPNAQLRALNPHVEKSLHSHASCYVPTQANALTGEGRVGTEIGGGVSSFGYAGTIAHTVIRHRSADGSPPMQLLVYERRAFPWSDLPHPFSQRRVPSTEGNIAFRSPVAGALHAITADHVVQSRVVFPGAGYLEMARAVEGPGAALSGVFFLQPLMVEAPGLHVECAVRDGRFEVRSGNDDALTDATVHCAGTLASSDSWSVDHSSMRACVGVRSAHVDALYDGFDATGLQYGPGYRTLVQAWGGVSDSLARLQVRLHRQGTQVHPADLDDALCTSALTSTGESGGQTWLPFALDDALLQGESSALWAVTRL